ncbi:MAG: hypothetical protein J6A15_06210 [Clostridia bacterium]|nr:hypothetical protein [Clostridia bacterium]
MENEKAVDEQKMREYLGVLDVIKDTVKVENKAKVCLKNHMLRTLAGYTSESTEDNFNVYIKDYMDKLSYDEHNRKVTEAKKDNDNARLQQLSNEVMGMAGYINNEQQTSNRRVNRYAKSFVDRTLLDRKFVKLYGAIESGEEATINQAYREIYSMTSYSKNQPYGVVNDYAQTFVDSEIDKFIERGIHVPNSIQERQYAI